MTDAATRPYTVTGKITSGPLRGKPLVERYLYRVTTNIGFEPMKGTLDVKIPHPINLKPFASSTVEHVLLDGSRRVELYIAPVTLIVHHEPTFAPIDRKPDFSKKSLPERIDDLREHQERIIAMEQQLEGMQHRTQEHACFAIQEQRAIDKSVVELIDRVNLRETLSLKDGSIVDLRFVEQRRR